MPPKISAEVAKAHIKRAVAKRPATVTVAEESAVEGGTRKRRAEEAARPEVRPRPAVVLEGVPAAAVELMEEAGIITPGYEVTVARPPPRRPAKAGGADEVARGRNAEVARSLSSSALRREGKRPAEPAEPVEPAGNTAVEEDCTFVDLTSLRSKSGCQDAAVAKRLLSAVILDKDREAAEARPSEEILLSAYSAFVKGISETMVLEDRVAKLSELSKSWKSLVQEAVVEKEVAQELLATAEKRAGDYAAENEGLKKKVAAAEAKSAASEAKLRKKKKKCTSNKLCIASLEKKLSNSEALLSDSIAAGVQNETVATEARLKIASLEGEVAGFAGKLEVARVEAVEAYKYSGDFVSDATEACADFWVFGFDECRSQVSRKYPGLDLEGVDYTVEEAEVATGAGQLEPVAGSTMEEPCLIPEDEQPAVAVQTPVDHA